MSGYIHMMLSNSEADKQAVLQQCEDLGRKEGGGAAARAGFYVKLAELAKAKSLDVTNAAEVWDKYNSGASMAASIVGGFKQSKKPLDTRKVRVSECRAFLKMGGLFYVDGVEVLDRAVGIIKKARQAGELTSKATDAMLNVARAQNDDEQNPLDDETIRIVMFPKESPDKTEADELEAVSVRLGAIAKKHGPSNDVSTAIAVLRQRIADLGGVTPKKSKKK